MKRMFSFIDRLAKDVSSSMGGRKDVSHIARQKAVAKELVFNLRYRLLELGFTERAYGDLRRLLKSRRNAYIKRAAAWQLALWHADKYTKADARESLKLLRIAARGEVDPVQLNRIAVLQAESYELLGQADAGKEIIERALAKSPQADLYLAAANLEEQIEDRVVWMNKALTLHSLTPIRYDGSKGGTAYDSIVSDDHGGTANYADMPKVSVIVPTYNAEGTVTAALDSLLAQTWENLEILVVDDGSTDGTAAVVRAYTKREPKVRLIKSRKNEGPYVARNLALKTATGEFVTCNDADDWSHPQRIEKQVRHLLDNPSVAANTSQQSRATNNLVFYRRGNPGFYVQPNMPSLMFRRKQVMDAVGFWDSVRFDADSEFVKRLIKTYGPEAIVHLTSGPLSFQRRTQSSLTGSESFGYPGYSMGARKEYKESYTVYHDTASSLRYTFPSKRRPFPVPMPMRPDRVAPPKQRRYLRTVLVSDFRLGGDVGSLNIEHIAKYSEGESEVGLVQMSRYDQDPRRPIDPQVRKIINGETVQMLTYGERIACDTLVVLLPDTLQEQQRYVPDVAAKRVRVILNKPAHEGATLTSGRVFGDTKRVLNFTRVFGEPEPWALVDVRTAEAAIL